MTYATAEQVAEALQLAWNDFVDDTGCHPDAFQRYARSGIAADFSRGNFAESVSGWLNQIVARGSVPLPEDTT